MEKGGRAGKLGDLYEYRWLAKQLFRLSTEKILSLIHEPSGDIENGIDIVINEKNGNTILYQCKSSNGHNGDWTLAKLNSLGVFTRLKQHLDADEKYSYVLVSPNKCHELEELTLRARNSGTSTEFYENQVKHHYKKNNKKIEKYFDSFIEYMGLLPLDDYNKEAARNYLSRIDVHIFPDSNTQKVELLETFQETYHAEREDVYFYLAYYTVENDKFGHTITIAEINNYLSSKGIIKFDLSNQPQIWDRINDLNSDYKNSFTLLRNKIIPRSETECVYKKVKDNDSVLLHGSAGSGKSGCIHELIMKLEECEMPYLVLKLDKNITQAVSTNYGIIDLGLPASPAICLAQAAYNSSCVLILDQLDAVRWTAQANGAALDMCKDLIRQVTKMKIEDKCKMSIVFICRTFDVENDNGIKLLFQTKDEHEKHLVWEKIEVKELKEDTVKEITGHVYASFTDKFKKLLSNINNLSIWSQLNDERKKDGYTSTYELIRSYWDQFQDKGEKLGITPSDLSNLKKLLVTKMQETSCLVIPKEMLRDASQNAKKLAISENIIIENNSYISFVHQTFLDVFMVETMVEQVHLNTSIEKILGTPDNQTPAIRYKLQMLLQVLFERGNQGILLKYGKDLIESINVRYYMKYVFWEVIGQEDSITTELFDFIKGYLQSSWFNAIVYTVVFNHPYYVNLFLEGGIIAEWLRSEKINNALDVLRSVNNKMGDQVIAAIKPLAFLNKEIDQKIYQVLCRDFFDDSELMFQFRLQLFESNPEFLQNFLYINLNSFSNEDLLKYAKLLYTLLSFNDEFPSENIRHYIDSKIDIFDYIGSSLPDYVLTFFLPVIEEKTFGGKSFYSWQIKGWADMDVQPTVGRAIIRMAVKAMITMGINNPELYFEYFHKYSSSSSLFIIEILLYSALEMPTEYSEVIMKWLVSDSYKNFFDKTGVLKMELDAAKALISKFSKHCSDETFKLLEYLILNFCEEYGYDYLKERIEFNRCIYKRDYSSGKKFASWFFWGEFQAYLLSSLDVSRTSEITKQLIPVLNRRFLDYELGGHKARIISGFGKSPINSDVYLKFTNKQWIKIIKSEKMNSKEHLIKQNQRFDFKQTTHEEFARLYESAGKTDPERFVALSLSFPVDVDRHYIQAAWSVAALTDHPQGSIPDWKPASANIVMQSAYRYLNHKDKDEMNFCMSLCRLVNDRAEEAWDDDVINRIILLALQYKDELKISESEIDLLTQSINSVRGTAAHALSSLLWSDYKRFERLKPSIKKLVYNKSSIVKQGILEAVIATMNIDKKQAAEWFFSIINSNEQIARYTRSIKIIFSLWRDFKEECMNAIYNLFTSSDEKSQEMGAFIATNIYIVFDDEPFYDLVFSGKLEHGHLEGCSRVSIALMENATLHDKAKSVIEEILTYSGDLTKYVQRIFYNDRLIFPQDISLMKRVISLNPNNFSLELDSYIKRNDINIINIADIVIHTCEQFFKDDNKDSLIKGGYYSMIYEMPKYITMLYDRAENHAEVRKKCLDMWDFLYQNDIADIRSMTKQIMEL